MLRNKKITKGLSLLITMVMVLGYFTSFVYAENDQLSSARVDLSKEASEKIEIEVMKDFDNEDLVEVLVYMKDQVDTEMVARATRNAVSSAMTPYSTKLEVRRGVVEALRDKAEMTQMDIVNYLEQEMESGNVVEFTPYHIVNMVYVKATKEVVENISFMTEVEKIYKNKVHTLEKPEMSEEIQPSATDVEWNVERVKADQVWELGIDGTGAVVGSLDSGVDWTHPTLKSKWRGYDADTGTTTSAGNWFDPVYNAALPADSDDHGTHVMGTMVGSAPDGSNKIGMAPGAKWISARVFNTAGSTTDTILISAAQWMTAPNGDSNLAPDVVNNSWGGGAGIDDWYRDVVRNWRAAGILPVFSAGNQRSGEPLPGPGSISCPANYPESFAVAATDKSDIRASWSKLGPSPYEPSKIKPDISGPGVGIRSSIPGGAYGSNSGTSMSAPAISGAAALLVSANSSLSVEDIEEIIKETARPLTDTQYPIAPNFGYGYGMVDAFEAVSSVASGTGYIAGRVLKDGEDMEDAVIIHEQEVTEVYAGSDIDVIAQIKDDVAVTEVELLVKQQGKSYWLLVPMNRISGDHKDGMYKGTITYDMLVGDSLVYKIRARDYAGEGVVSQDYKINISFGIIPGEYTQGFEENAPGWIFDGAWEWGKPSGTSPQPFEGENLAGTVLAGNYPNSSDSWMITPPIDLRDNTLGSATLRFQQWYELENNYDKGYVLVTNDYGETWTEVRPIITGDAKSWKEVVVNLGEYIGSQDPVFVAYRFTSDSSGQRIGWYIDNVKIVGVDNEAPATPIGLTAEAGLTGIKLNWTAVADGDLANYKVYRSLTSDEGFELIASPSNNAFTDTTAEPGITYYYKVAAKDFSGNLSGFSNIASASISEVTMIFAADFEENNGGFTSGTTAGTLNPWAWGVPTSGSNGATSGEKLWATNLAGNYENGTDAYIETPSIVIPSDKNATLTFNHWVDMEGTSTLWDYGQVLISKDDGATWTNITPVAGQKYGKRVQAWADQEIALSGYSGETVKLRFFFHSDGSGVYAGWYIDDIYVVGLDAQPTEPPVEPEPPTEGKVESKKVDYKDPVAPNYNLKRTETNNYATVEDVEVANTPMARGTGLPIVDAIVTVLENGRSVKTDPVTGKFNMRHPIGDSFTLRAEAYGYYSEEITVAVNEDQTTNTIFVLEEKPQGTITGTVADRYYGTPAAYAIVRVVEDAKVPPVTADAEGNFTIPNVYEGRYTLKVVANGFESGEATVDVVGNQTVEINIGLKKFVGYEDQIIYDDGTGENALVLNAAGNGLAVRFTPGKFGKVKGANMYFWDTSFPSPGGTKIGVVIYDIDSTGKPVAVGTPKYVTVTRGAWNYIDLSEYGFSTDRDFYISTMQDVAGTSCPALGIDEASPYGDRSYMNVAGDFKLISTEDIAGGLMTRAVMEYSMSVPVITNLGELTYTNQDAITVEGTVTADGKVNVYVNGAKVNSVDTVNKMFSVNVNLPLDEDTIMVTAEMNGAETEPSTPVRVVKDKVAPTLVVNEPLDNAKIKVESVHVRGNVTDNIKLAKLEINEKEIIVDGIGNFHERLILNPGINVITVKATDNAGNITTVVRTVTVELNAPVIINIEPSQDVELEAGDVLTVSFNAPTGGRGYFRLMVPFGLQSNEIGIPMTEVDGFYTGTWTIPAETEAQDLQIEMVYISEYGYEVTKVAEGRVRIVLVDSEPTSIINLHPTGSTELRTDETLEISFNAPTGGRAYYRIMLPFGPLNSNPGSTMTEVTPGFYKATYTAHQGVVASDLQIEVIFVGADGTKLSDIAEGKISLIGDMNALPVSTIILGDEAFDMDYLNTNSEAQAKLIEWFNLGNAVYSKLNSDTIVDEGGNKVTIDVLPKLVRYFDTEGIKLYAK